MRIRWQLFVIKARLSAKTLSWLMTKWRYALLALLVALLFFELMYWLFNLNILTTILLSGNVSFGDKLAVLASPLRSILVSSGATTLVLMIILSLVQGLNIAALTYVVRHQQKLDTEAIGGSSIISLLVLFGLGCPACGTSLITPIVAIFVSGSAVAVSEQIMMFILPIALLVGLYGLYVIGIKTANARVAAEGIPE